MIFERFYEESLAQVSYMVGCRASGDALVVDANRILDPYLHAAEHHGLEITAVAETHIHADFVSGSRELASRTGARLYLSGAAAAPWEYAFAKDSEAVLLRDGATWHVGSVRIEVVHSPGHTPEHLCLLVTDTAVADRPMGIFTGDFVFVGDVGRPDLLEAAVGTSGAATDGARALFRSLRSFAEYPDSLQLWPGHGAGSACGRSLSAVPTSTVGYERRFNWAFSIPDEDAFVRAVLADQPEVPSYFARTKEINRDDPPLTQPPRRPPRLADSRLSGVLASGATIVDTRAAEEFARGFLPGTINIPLNRRFTTWAGSVLPYDRDLYLVLDDGCADNLERVTSYLALIGLDEIAGYFGIGAVRRSVAPGETPARIPRMGAADLPTDAAVVDVRGRAEWEGAHIAGAVNIPVGQLAERIGEVLRDRTVVVHCQTGARSAIAASILRAAGVESVINMTDGVGAWERSGRPVIRSPARDQ